MIPSAAAVSGMYSVDMTAAKTGEKPVHSTTRTKISQTWLVSHTGPRACSISDRVRRPFSALPANRSQKPPPKSAPAKRM